MTSARTIRFRPQIPWPREFIELHMVNAQPEDAAQVRSILTDAITALSGVAYNPELPIKKSDLVDFDPQGVRIIRDGGYSVGVYKAQTKQTSTTGIPWVHLEGPAIRNEYQMDGIGRQVLQAIEEEAQQHDVAILMGRVPVHSYLREWYMNRGWNPLPDSPLEKMFNKVPATWFFKPHNLGYAVAQAGGFVDELHEELLQTVLEQDRTRFRRKLE